MLSRKKRVTSSRRKKASRCIKQASQATVGKLLERLEVLFEVTAPSITTLIAEANGRANRAEKKFNELEARVKQLTECLTEDHLEAAHIMQVDALVYLTELLNIKKKQLFTTESIGVLSPYRGHFGNGTAANIVPLCTLPKGSTKELKS